MSYLTLSIELTLIPLVFIFSLLFTGWVRNYALNHSIVDQPNERSSHSITTPRGGGLCISLSVLIVILILHNLGELKTDYTTALFGGGFIVALTGWLDDHKHIHAALRSLIYLAAASWSVYWLGGVELLGFGSFFIESPLILSGLAIVGVIWLTNLYNFMDGADGLAGVQAICTALPCGGLFWLDDEKGLAICCFAIAASSVGFLYWNWPTAKIFMGDVGSCFLGFIFAILALIAEIQDSFSILICGILLSVFITDTTLTLVLRLCRKDAWYRAHRSHSYQLYLQMGASHQKLVLLLLAINLFVMWPLVLVAIYIGKLTLYMLIISVIITTVFWVRIQSRFYKV